MKYNKYPNEIFNFCILEYPKYVGSRISFCNKINNHFNTNYDINRLVCYIKTLRVKKIRHKTGKFITCNVCGENFYISKSESNKFRTNAMFCSMKCKSKFLKGKYPSNIPKDSWKKAVIKNKINGLYKRHSIRMKSGGAIKARKANNSKKINKPESEILKYINDNNLNFEFVGDSKKWIGRFNPDFISTNNSKKIIEYFGDYWHREDADRKDEKRLKAYSSAGYDTLVIWEHDFNKNKNAIFNKIKHFDGGVCSTDII